MKNAYSRYLFSILLIFGMLLPFAHSTFQAGATPIANPILTVTIESISFPEFNTDLFRKDSKFFAVVNILGSPLAYNCGGRMAANADGVIHANWKFSQQIDRRLLASPLPVYINIEELIAPIEDEPNVDAHCNIQAISGGNPQEFIVDRYGGEERKTIRFDVTLSPCEARLERLILAQSCGTPITLHPPPSDARTADVTFRVDIQEPASTTLLGIKCTHAPIWPQATDTVTITANALDDNPAPTSVASIEIWVNSKAGPVQMGSGSSLTYTAGPFNSAFSYGCRVIKDGVAIFSGWRVVTVGPPPEGEEAVPILYNGFRNGSIDIVFIPDNDSYTGANDVQFLSEIGKIIGEYYNEKVFLDHQQQINFWIARDMGDADGIDITCTRLQPPPNWATAYSFADAGAIIHTDSFRDCADHWKRVFSYEAGDLRVFLHETGHSPFGLADEYCGTVCDGGYHDGQNLFSNLENCKYVSSTTTCRQLTNGTITLGWYTSDPSSNHLMEDNRRAQKLDERGITRVFDECGRLMSLPGGS